MSIYDIHNRCNGFIVMARSVPFCEGHGTGARNQFNAITAFVDASNVYGSTDSVAKSLRTYGGGMLKVQSCYEDCTDINDVIEILFMSLGQI